MKDNNDDVRFNKLNPNDNDIDNGRGYEQARRVENIADDLLQRFGLSKESRPFMCKVAYNLPEARIWQHYEQATTPISKGRPVTNPVGLFIWLCKRDMR